MTCLEEGSEAEGGTEDTTDSRSVVGSGTSAGGRGSTRGGTLGS